MSKVLVGASMRWLGANVKGEGTLLPGRYTWMRFPAVAVVAKVWRYEKMGLPLKSILPLTATRSDPWRETTLRVLFSKGSRI